MVDAPAIEPAEPVGVAQVVTPSGIEVYYQAGPKRLYRLRRDWPAEELERWEKETGEHRDAYPIDPEWVEVPSVTTVNDCLNKPGLPWWGMKVGVDGVSELIKRGLISYVDFANGLGLSPAMWLGDHWQALDIDGLVSLLTEHKLTTNHVRDKAGDRGQAAHDALEVWARDGIKPDSSVYPPEVAGYIVGLLRFLEDAAFEPEDIEIMVGSLDHRFAGRYDFRGSIPEVRRVVARKTPKQVRYTEIPAGKYLLDLKTSKEVYDTHMLQCEAYELASVECGYEPTDYRAVIHVTSDGWYEMVKSVATAEDFLAVKEASDALADLHERRKVKKK